MPVVEDEHVFRLEIAMDDAAGVGRLQPARHLCRNRNRPGRRERSNLNELAQHAPVEQFGDGIAHAVLVPEVVNGEDIRMGQGRDDPRLALEARDAIRIRSDGIRQHLDSHIAAQVPVVRAIHLAHASGPERRENLECAKTSAAREGHRRPDGNTQPRPTSGSKLREPRRVSSPRPELGARLLHPARAR